MQEPAMMGGHPSVYHHGDGHAEFVADWYDELFLHGVPGDWLWHEISDVECIFLLVPDIIGSSRGTLHGVDLLVLYPRHTSGNWAKPGDVDGWDGDRESPTLSPSILHQVNGVNGWHGYFRGGKIEAA